MIKQYEVHLVNLDPAVGHEIRKTRPCAVLSPDEMNESIETVIIAPLTTRSRPYPTRIQLQFGGKKGFIVLDQIRTVDKRRLVKRLGKLPVRTVKHTKETLREMLVD